MKLHTANHLISGTTSFMEARRNRPFRSSCAKTPMLLGLRSLAALLLCCVCFCSCDRNSAQIRSLEEENARLRKALEEARGGGATAHSPVQGHADLDLTLKELWSQRFEDNQFRAKQRLDQKQVRVTGQLESVSDRSVTLFDTRTTFGSVTLLAQFDDAYIKEISEGLASLQKGMQLTVQGRFLFDKMSIDGAIFVDRATGKQLDSRDLARMEPNSEQSAKNDPSIKQ
jgi:hypothetical protein